MALEAILYKKAQRTSRLPEEQRETVLKLHTKYIKYLSFANSIDPYIQALPAPNGNKEFSSVIIDEAQSAPISVISHVKKSKTPCDLFMDTCQAIGSLRTPLSYLPTSTGGIDTFSGSFRSPKNVAQFAQKILRTLYHISGGAADGNESYEFYSRREAVGSIFWPQSATDKEAGLDTIEALYKKTDTALNTIVICFTKKGMIRACRNSQLKAAVAAGRIHMIDDVGGLEFDHVILWEPEVLYDTLKHDDWAFANMPFPKQLKVTKACNLDGDGESKILSLKTFFLAVTRARKKLYFIPQNQNIPKVSYRVRDLLMDGIVHEMEEGPVKNKMLSRDEQIDSCIADIKRWHLLNKTTAKATYKAILCNLMAIPPSYDELVESVEQEIRNADEDALGEHTGALQAPKRESLKELVIAYTNNNRLSPLRHTKLKRMLTAALSHAESLTPFEMFLDDVRLGALFLKQLGERLKVSRRSDSLNDGQEALLKTLFCSKVFIESLVTSFEYA